MEIRLIMEAHLPNTSPGSEPWWLIIKLDFKIKLIKLWLGNFKIIY